MTPTMYQVTRFKEQQEHFREYSKERQASLDNGGETLGMAGRGPRDRKAKPGPGFV